MLLLSILWNILNSPFFIFAANTTELSSCSYYIALRLAVGGFSQQKRRKPKRKRERKAGREIEADRALLIFSF